MSGGEALRLFVAVPAPAGVREVAEAAIRRLRGAGDARWVAGERLHLTLKFLGATPAEKVDLAGQLLAKTANTFSSFVVDLGGLGAFPNLRRPQTVWLGLQGVGTVNLEALARAVEQELQTLGIPGETKRFHPHLTLGRVRSPRGLPELVRRLAEAPESAPVEWKVEEIHLVRSVLGPESPDYTVLRRFPLQGEEKPVDCL